MDIFPAIIVVSVAVSIRPRPFYNRLSVISADSRDEHAAQKQAYDVREDVTGAR